MTDNKQHNWKISEIIILSAILLFIIAHAIIRNDSTIAMISALCGITYTFIAGKGLPICYIFGLIGSSFYCVISYQNALWGNLLLYAAYYIPMQLLGYFQWNKNLKEGKKDIIKIKLPTKELLILLFSLTLLSIIVFFILCYLKDTHPILDSITTVFSIGGMYLTVRRAIEQWQLWMVVNALSLAMWLTVALNGARVYSTVFMWAVYLFLAFYFYFDWEKELK